MRNTILAIYLFIFSFVFSQEKQADPPQLVVGITIDGLRGEHLQKMWKYFSPGGFRKIVSEGVDFEHIQHNIVSSGNTADAATFVTGTYPFYHGVSGDCFFSRLDNQVFSILNDKNQTGIGTKEKYSALRLLSSTFTDELMMSNPMTQVHSIGIEAEESIIMGGHTATSVSWIEEDTNRWATTAYYDKGLSRWADMMNANGTFGKITSEKWTPSAGISTYMNPTVKGSRTVAFSYNPLDKREGNSTQKLLKNTPAANALVAELAKNIFEREKLGSDKNTDVLMLQFTVNTPNQIVSSLVFAEQEDMYIRLDREIQTLLHTFTAKVGTDKLLVFMMGSGSDIHSPAELGKKQIPAGFLNADRTLALLNTYLMAIYGQEKWITGYYGKNIFLNRKKIEDKKLDWIEFQNKVTEFLIEFEGIQAAYTTSEIVNFAGDSSDIRTKFRNSFHKNTSGDIVITLMPGWVEVDNKGKIVGNANTPQVFVPFYLMGNGLKPKKNIVNYRTVDIAPTLAKMLRIPNPNACVGKEMDI